MNSFLKPTTSHYTLIQGHLKKGIIHLFETITYQYNHIVDICKLYAVCNLVLWAYINKYHLLQYDFTNKTIIILKCLTC